MYGLHFDYNEDKFRKTFLSYVLDTHPKWTRRTAQTCVSDAIFVRDSLSNGMLNLVFEQEDWTPEIEGYLLSVLVQDVLAMRKNPRKDAKGYIRAFRVYFSFLRLVKLIEESKIDKPRDIRRSGGFGIA